MRHLLQGMSGGPGIAFGVTARLDETATATPDGGNTMDRFRQVQGQVVAQLREMATELRVEGKTDEAAIFDGQAQLAADAVLTEEVRRHAEDEHNSLSAAIGLAVSGMAEVLGSLHDPYLRERAADVLAIGKQLQQQLAGAGPAPAVPADAIVISHDLTPLETALLRKGGVAGLAVAGGTPTGHVAILARALGLPAVVGLGDALMDVPSGAAAILVADAGTLIIDPERGDIDTYGELQHAKTAATERRGVLQPVAPLMRDGQPVALWANIGDPAEAEEALRFGAVGIGLLRTEFLLLQRSEPAGEEEQYQAYAAVLHVMVGRPVVARTLDIGGDKALPYLLPLHEANPFLGTRGIRWAMRWPELFRTQIRALLRAAVHGDLRIMLPMVTTPEDVQWARSELDLVVDELAQAGIDHRAGLPLGIMVETPAVALALDRFPGIDFCSVGSNDLAQYTLAADRTNAALAQRYRHDDPAVFRVIRATAVAASRAGIPISVCGELAGEAAHAPALVGLGITRLSMVPPAIPRVAEALRLVSRRDAEAAAASACDDRL